jgi:hypothetical protein
MRLLRRVTEPSTTNLASVVAQVWRPRIVVPRLLGVSWKKPRLGLVPLPEPNPGTALVKTVVPAILAPLRSMAPPGLVVAGIPRVYRIVVRSGLLVWRLPDRVDSFAANSRSQISIPETMS